MPQQMRPPAFQPPSQVPALILPVDGAGCQRKGGGGDLNLPPVLEPFGSPPSLLVAAQVTVQCGGTGGRGGSQMAIKLAASPKAPCGSTRGGAR